MPGDGALPHAPLSAEVQQVTSSKPFAKRGRTLEALFDVYAEGKRSTDKSRSTEVTLGEYGSAIDDFIELHGNVHVESISRDLVSEHHVELAKLPGKGKGMAKLTASERIARAERGGLPRLSTATVRNRLRKLSAVLTYGVGRGWLTENPINASGLGREVARAATRQQVPCGGESTTHPKSCLQSSPALHSQTRLGRRRRGFRNVVIPKICPTSTSRPMRAAAAACACWRGSTSTGRE